MTIIISIQRTYKIIGLKDKFNFIIFVSRSISYWIFSLSTTILRYNYFILSIVLVISVRCIHIKHCCATAPLPQQGTEDLLLNMVVYIAVGGGQVNWDTYLENNIINKEVYWLCSRVNVRLLPKKRVRGNNCKTSNVILYINDSNRPKSEGVLKNAIYWQINTHKEFTKKAASRTWKHYARICT